MADDITEAQAYLNRKKDKKVGMVSTKAGDTLCPLARAAGKGLPSTEKLSSGSPTGEAKEI